MVSYKILKKRAFLNRKRVRQHRQIKKILVQRYRDVENEAEIGSDEHLSENESNIRDGITTRERLRSWANCHGITTRAINDLLKILLLAGKKLDLLTDVPFDFVQ